MQLQKDMKLAAERAAGELEAGMEAKRAEVRKVQDRAEQAEAEGSEMRALVEELTHAGQVRGPCEVYCVYLIASARPQSRCTRRSSMTLRIGSGRWKIEIDLLRRSFKKPEKTVKRRSRLQHSQLEPQRQKLTMKL